MKTIAIFLLGLTILSCQTADLKSESPEIIMAQVPDPNYDMAIQFINDYLDFSNDAKSEVGLIDWVSNRNDVTAGFKNKLRFVLAEAEKNDPELGLGFDPILDAQDSPDKFELDKTDSVYLTVKGVNLPEFKLTLKLKLEENKWLVDGAGIINVPENKRVKR